MLGALSWISAAFISMLASNVVITIGVLAWVYFPFVGDWIALPTFILAMTAFGLTLHWLCSIGWTSRDGPYDSRYMTSGFEENTIWRRLQRKVNQEHNRG